MKMDEVYARLDAETPTEGSNWLRTLAPHSWGSNSASALTRVLLASLSLGISIINIETIASNSWDYYKQSILHWIVSHSINTYN